MTEIISELRARTRWILVAMALGGLATLAWFWIEPPMYRSTIEFYTVEPAVEKETVTARDDGSVRLARLFHIATSTPLFDRLIQRFDLHAHFGITDTSALGRARIIAELSDHISAEITKMSSLEIHVRDKDRRMAADLANAVFDEMRILYSAEEREELRHDMQIHRQVLDSTSGLVSTKTAEIMRLATQIRDLLESGGPDQSTRLQLIELEHQMIRSSAEVGIANEELITGSQRLAYFDASLGSLDLSRTRLKRRATEDVNTKPVWIIIRWTFTVMVAAAFATALVFLMILDTKPLPSRARVRAFEEV